MGDWCENKVGGGEGKSAIVSEGWKMVKKRGICERQGSAGNELIQFSNHGVDGLEHVKSN